MCHFTTSVTVYLWLRYSSSNCGMVTSSRSRSIACWEALFAVEETVVCALSDPPATASTTRKYQNPTRIFMTSFREIDVSYENTGPLERGYLDHFASVERRQFFIALLVKLRAPRLWAFRYDCALRTHAPTALAFWPMLGAGSDRVVS